MTVVGSAALGLSVVAAPVASADAPAGPAPMQQRSASTVTADVLPTVQIDSGVVLSQAIVGTIDYAGGSFSQTRPAGAAAGTNLTARGNLLAFDITTGNLLTSFAPSLNGKVDVVRASPDGSRIYVGGTFSTADGQTRYNLAAYSTSTGQLLSTFKPPVGGSYVNALAVTNTTVYVGGLLSAGDGVTRKNLMAFDAATGKLLSWAPTTDLQVDAMVMTPDNSKVIIGGRFAQVNGAAQRGLAALDPSSGATLPWTAPSVVQNGWNDGGQYSGRAGIYSLSTDGTAIYGTGWVYANAQIGNLEGSFSAVPSTGNINWVEDCHGDTYGAYSDGTQVYTVDHKHDCSTVGGFPQAYPAPGNMRHAEAFTTATMGVLGHSPEAGVSYKDWAGTPAPALINWFPDWVTGSATGQGQAGWTVTGNGTYVVVGGEFPYVNGTLQQGLVRFAKPGVSPSKQGPRRSGSKWVPTVFSDRSGIAHVTVPSNWDRDDITLNYAVARSGRTTPIATATVKSEFWNTPTLNFTDSGLTPGASYTYTVKATDPDGNTATSAAVKVTVASGAPGVYAQQVAADGASTYWRLGEPVGTAVYDWIGTNDATIGPGVTRGTSGAIVGDANGSTTFDGDAAGGGSMSTGTAVQAPDTFTTEAWFRTTTTAGGKIFGFGDQPQGTDSMSYDRQVYMLADGTLRFGVYSNAVVTVGGTTAYNDGQWHQVVAELSPSGMALFVDGVSVATDPSTTTGQPYAGYWRVGGDNLYGWPQMPSSSYFAGDIDDVSIYPTALSGQRIANQYALARHPADAAGPTDAYGAAVYGTHPDFYWRLDDAAGATTEPDAGSNNITGTVSGQPGFGAAGIAGTAATFGNSAVIAESTAVTNPTVYSEAAWFKTSTTTGGKIIGFGNKNSGTSTSYDRHVYLQDNGQLVFGTTTTSRNIIVTPRSYNDGQWHQVVATQGPAGMALWVDGQMIVSNTQTQAQAYTGYWRIGGDRTWGSTSPWFAGTIDEVAVYSRVLSPSEIQQQYNLGS